MKRPAQRPKTPASERQARYREAHDLVSIDVSRANAERLADLRRRRRLTTDGVLQAALEALAATTATDGSARAAVLPSPLPGRAERPAGAARLPPGGVADAARAEVLSPSPGDASRRAPAPSEPTTGRRRPASAHPAAAPAGPRSPRADDGAASLRQGDLFGDQAKRRRGQD